MFPPGRDRCNLNRCRRTVTPCRHLFLLNAWAIPVWIYNLDNTCLDSARRCTALLASCTNHAYLVLLIWVYLISSTIDIRQN